MTRFEKGLTILRDCQEFKLGLERNKAKGESLPSLETLFALLKKEVVELGEAIEDIHKIDGDTCVALECGDVANYCAMICELVHSKKY